MGVRVLLCQFGRRCHNVQFLYQYTKGLAGTYLSTAPDFNSQVRLASGTRLTPEELQKQTKLRQYEGNITGSGSSWQDKLGTPRTGVKHRDGSRQKFAKEPKLSSAGNRNYVHRRADTAMREYISEIVLGTHDDDNEMGHIQEDVYTSQMKAQNYARNRHNRNRNLPFSRTKHPQNNYKQMKYTKGTFDEGGVSGIEFEEDDDETSDIVFKRKSKRAMFMENSSEYNSTSALKVIQSQMKYYRPDKDDMKVKLLVECIANNQTMSQDVVSEGIQSFCRLPSDKLQEYTGVELPLNLARVICEWASTFDVDVFCAALLMCVRLHCSLSPKEVCVLEEECLRRLRSLGLHSMLLISDCWLCLDQFQLSYHQQMFSTAVDDLFYGTELTGQIVTQIFYIMGLNKTKHPPKWIISKLLKTIENSLGELTWLEIAMTCYGLIKASAPSDGRPGGFLSALSKKFICGLQADQIDMFSTIQIMRYLSRCYHCDVKTFDALAATLTPVICNNLDLTANSENRFPGLRVPHVATAFAKVKMFHKPLMDAIMECVLQEYRTMRTKDVKLLLWAFGRLNYKPSHSDRFFQYLIEIMQAKVHTRMMYPEILLRSLVSLSFLENYPATLIDQAFSPAFLQLCDEHIAKSGFNIICKLLFSLDCSVAVECPGYDGNRLPEHYIRLYENVLHGSAFHTNEIAESGANADVIRLLGKMFGNKEYVKFHAILPHIKTPVDIEVHLDAQGNPVFPESFHSDHSLGPNLSNVAIPYYKLNQLVKETIEERNSQKTQRLAVLVTRASQYHCNSPELLGVHVMKKRQLRKVGYKIIEIPHFEWSQLCDKDEDVQINYLKNKLANPS